MSSELAINARLDTIVERLDRMAEAQRKRDELFEEMTPILRLMMQAGVERLDELDQKGYFRFGKSLTEVLDNIVAGYSPEDVKELAQNVVAILELVRSVTQPDALTLAGEVSEAAHLADSVEPVGVVGMMKASQDDDAQRGMAVLLDVLKRLGKGVKKAQRRKNLERQLGARRGHKAGSAPLRQAPTQRAPRTATTPSCTTPPSPTPAPVTPATVNLAGVTLTAEGFLSDATQWNRDVAERLSASLGVTLTDAHWTLFEFARGEYAKTGTSPNIRRLTSGSGLTTKQLYQMFPKSPGKFTAMIAGLPKPAGCI